LESGVPVSINNQTAKTTLYFTPYNGNSISLYDGSEWDLFSFSELSLSLSGYTANTNYDIFIYDNSGTLTLESTAWTNNTTRATSLTTQDGIYVKSGATTRRYLGTIRITGTTGQCEDSGSRRLVWNLYNQVTKALATAIAATHTYSTEAWRPWNNNTTIGQGRQDFVIGMPLIVYTMAGGQFKYGFIDFGRNSTYVTTSFHAYNGSATESIGTQCSSEIFYTDGYYYIQALQYGISASSQFYILYLNSSFLG
jgi:hypothetical protein